MRLEPHERVIEITTARLNEAQLDFLRELENIGAGNAATALSSILGRPVALEVPVARIVGIAQMPEIMEDAERLVTGSIVGMNGDLEGLILFIQTIEDATMLSNTMLRGAGVLDEQGDFPTEMQKSALLELSNILCGAYVNAIAELAALRINCSVPVFTIDMAGAIMNVPAAMYGMSGDVALLLETVFCENNLNAVSRFFLIPDIRSRDTLMKKMGIA